MVYVPMMYFSPNEVEITVENGVRICRPKAVRYEGFGETYWVMDADKPAFKAACERVGIRIIHEC